MHVDATRDPGFDDWRREIRQRVERTLEADVTGPLGDRSDPYAAASRPGRSSLLVLVAGRCFDDQPGVAMDAAVAVEFVRLHLQTHNAISTTVQQDAGNDLLVGDCYRALGDQALLTCPGSPATSVAAVDCLSSTVTRALEELARVDVGTVDPLLADGAVRLSRELFALRPSASCALAAYARRVRSDRSWTLDPVPAVISAVPERAGRSALLRLATADTRAGPT